MYTYPIAVGSDSISHKEVEAKFALELNEFRLGKNVSFYHGGVKKKSQFTWNYLFLFKINQNEEKLTVSCLGRVNIRHVGAIVWT